jgi:hypothetical protein
MVIALKEAGLNSQSLDCEPSKHRILDYGMRWGIECMFSDFKSRGFAITDTHVRKTDRLEKLLILTALFGAVSIGMTPQDPSEQNHSKKTPQIYVLCIQTRTPPYNQLFVLPCFFSCPLDVPLMQWVVRSLI